MFSVMFTIFTFVTQSSADTFPLENVRG